MARAKKVYYDIAMTGVSGSQVVNLADADRYGNTLDVMAALTGSATAEQRQRQELSAFFVPHHGTHNFQTPYTQPGAFWVDFMRNSTLTAVYLTVGGASVPAKAGSSAVFTAAPRVRVAHIAMVGATRVIRGILYVQRQHTIEV